MWCCRFGKRGNGSLCSGDIFFDGNFDADSPGVGGFQTVTSLTNWNVTQSNVDALGVGFGCTGCIDLDGTASRDPAILETKQVLNFAAGVLYHFQLFFSGGSQEELVTFSIQGGLSFLAGSGASVFSRFEAPFADTASTMKIQMNAVQNNSGPYLDRVLVTYDDGVAPVPLSAGAPVLLAGLGGLGLVARRRRK